MSNITYIQVLLPLRLEWEPFYALPEGVSAVEGERVAVIFAHRRYVGVVSAVGVEPPGETLAQVKTILKKEEELPLVSPEEIAFWRAISEYYLCSVGEVYKAAYPQIHVRKRKKELRIPEALPPTAPIRLSAAQQQAFDSVQKAFARNKTVLLEGVTGSGKTEIYLQLIAEALRKGRSALYLVPEIALSRQLEERVAASYPAVLCYNSALTMAKRRDVAEILCSGKPYLVLGTRSALFLPHRNLGLVIVDEEHDTSYKQDSPAPRYHARESSIMLAGIHGAQVILGSATPSLESLYNAEKGIFNRVQLKQRFHSGEDASLLVVDTVAERRKRGMEGDLSRKLLYEIQQTLEAGEQVLLLRSRRAYAPAVQCVECGTIPKCPHCNVSLSLHKDPDRLVCHYCGHTEAYTGTCPQCGGSLQALGAGTQRIEEEIKAVFPTARVARLDSDNASEEASIIKSFAQGEIDILIGTQIITKGFDFENLSLVGVIQADNILGQQDFRADERAYQLLEQFRGRSGRREKPGRFVIQTREPDHPVFARLEGEADLTPMLLVERRQFGYPPYTRLVHIVLKDENEKRLQYLAQELARAIQEAVGPVVGPYAPVVDRVAGKYIRQMRLMLPRDKTLLVRKQSLAQTVARFENERKYAGHIVIDVDPV